MTPLIGPRLTLRPVEPTDLDCLYIWENDSSAWGIASTRAPLSRRQIHDYIESYDADIYAARQLRLVIEETATRRAIGAIDLYDFDPRDLRAFVAIYIALDSRRQGYGSEALTLMADYGRAVIGLHQIAAFVAVENTPSLTLFRHCGFNSCGRLRSWIKYNSRYHDVILLQRLFE